MAGHVGAERVRHAHGDTVGRVGEVAAFGRVAREELEDQVLAPGATRAEGAGDRESEEVSDPVRTCFERDRDRILHGTTAFRRLAGKTQVFIFPRDHQRTRLTHALEVTQVATSIARACRLNTALTEAIALGHDCGHGPFGHASEDAFGPYLDDGFHHATWGADVVLAELNLCRQTLDGIRNHSWSRPAPATPEGEVVSWADRIAYVCHDFEDAVRAEIVSPGMLPPAVLEHCGDRRSRQLDALIGGVVDAVEASGTVGMVEEMADALAAFRQFNYAHIYMRPASVEQGELVQRLLRGLVDYFAERHGGDIRASVSYVAGMTDRFAFTTAVRDLGWDPAALPAGIDTPNAPNLRQ